MLVKTCYKPEFIKTFAFLRVTLLASTFHLWLLCCCWWTKYAIGLISREFSWLWFYSFLCTSDRIVLDFRVMSSLLMFAQNLPKYWTWECLLCFYCVCALCYRLHCSCFMGSSYGCSSTGGAWQSAGWDLRYWK